MLRIISVVFTSILTGQDYVRVKCDCGRETTIQRSTRMPDDCGNCLHPSMDNKLTFGDPLPWNPKHFKAFCYCGRSTIATIDMKSCGHLPG